MKQYESASLNMRTYMQTSGRLSKQRINDSVYISFDYIFFLSADIKPNASIHFHEKQIKTIYESIKTYVNKTINVHLFFTAPFPLRSFFCVCRAFFAFFSFHIFFFRRFGFFSA